MIHHLALAGVAASLGSACASGSMEPSHALRAMNVPPGFLRGAIRVSLSRETTSEDIARAVDAVKAGVRKLHARAGQGAAASPPTALPSTEMVS